MSDITQKARALAIVCDHRGLPETTTVLRDCASEIERLRGLAIRAWHSFRSGLSQAGGCEQGLSDADIEELVRMAKENPTP